LNSPLVDILLGTYNGAQYLPEQLHSLELQTHANWRVIARDDGSSDATLALLLKFAEKHSGKVQIIPSGGVRLGPRGNFSELLRHSTASYTAFCDQDDVWLPEKLETLLQIVRTDRGGLLPILAHSDLTVVGHDARVMAKSFWSYQNINPARRTLAAHLVENTVTGCACIINAALREIASPIPKDAIMHDWWLALVASSAGQIVFTDVPLVRYRQHGNNDTGAKKWGARYITQRASKLLYDWSEFRSMMERCRSQAGALLQHAGVPLTDSQRTMIDGFVRLPGRSKYERVAFLLENRVGKTGLLRNAAMLVRV
jgi:glycosyltransferase involved in cell wall biosynthesis